MRLILLHDLQHIVPNNLFWDGKPQNSIGLMSDFTLDNKSMIEEYGYDNFLLWMVHLGINFIERWPLASQREKQREKGQNQPFMKFFIKLELDLSTCQLFFSKLIELQSFNKSLEIDLFSSLSCLFKLDVNDLWRWNLEFLYILLLEFEFQTNFSIPFIYFGRPLSFRKGGLSFEMILF